MKLIHKKRLLKLAKHLRSGKLGHAKFSFAHVNADNHGYELQHADAKCGTLGCAIGECPIAFPESWHFIHGTVALRRKRPDYQFSCMEHAESFFGLTEMEVDHLFRPADQCTSLYGGRSLGYNAKPASVAANIEAFVKRKEKKSQ